MALRSILGLSILAAFAAPALPGDSAPPAPSAAQQRLIGEYGPATDLLEIYEAGGRLYADGHGLHVQPLESASGLKADGGSVTLDGARLPRRDIGAEVVAQIRAGEHGDPAALRAAALRATPPAEPPAKRAMDLVPITRFDPTIKLDIRYAGSDNFMGFPLYERPAAYLQRPAAEALGRVQQALKAEGLGLLVHDAYRPWFVTRMFWDATPPEDHMFVADPARGSRHNRGCAVDLTLYDLATGRPVEMPGRYDEMSPRSYAAYAGGTSRQRWARDLLRRAMEREGFQVLAEEWWHFDYKEWADYPIGNTPFSALPD
ncbi:M15 family metallopeptidase [Phenylobacterium montanum]|uniref:D-alanyl-D-alanine dipeptidase n=1 Tax=Phenylobacterium montanum TaxID=2823693 RepID=A0A975G3V6_9CAUL|nr:M15 family metallopeptidase [Caulobacter sp. S6]QUD90083.1 M15 family metallopeptidase [Caulobacter sp. S6]